MQSRQLLSILKFDEYKFRSIVGIKLVAVKCYGTGSYRVRNCPSSGMNDRMWLFIFSIIQISLETKTKQYEVQHLRLHGPFSTQFLTPSDPSSNPHSPRPNAHSGRRSVLWSHPSIMHATNRVLVEARRSRLLRRRFHRQVVWPFPDHSVQETIGDLRLDRAVEDRELKFYPFLGRQTQPTNMWDIPVGFFDGPGGGMNRRSLIEYSTEKTLMWDRHQGRDQLFRDIDQ